MAGTLLNIAGAALLALGLALATVGIYGLLRRRDLFAKLHAAGLIGGPAIVLILAASVATRDLRVISSAVVLILFVLVTSPLSTHAIAQAAYRGGRREDRPGEERRPPADG